MCMIAYRPARKGNIPNAVIETAMRRHPDGFGVAWREDGALRSAKYGPSEREQFRSALRDIDRRGIEYVAHFRMATHGPKAQSHSHPYEYEDPDASVGKVLVFHNGIIDIETTPAESDTEVFVRDVLAHLPSRWWTSPALRYLVGEAIGWSKLVIMTGDETVNLHERKGKWDSGIWYSSDHKPFTVTYTTPGVITYKASDYEPRIIGKGKSPKGRAADTRLTVVKSAAESAKAFGIEDEPDWVFDPKNGWVNLITGEALSQYATPERTLYSSGHRLSLVADVDWRADGDYVNGVVCDECRTTGDLYVIDGGHYIDMSHLASLLDDTDVPEEVLR